MRLFNIIKNLSEVKTQTWTPTFKWSTAETSPTVANSNCYIDKIGNLYCFRGRFQITAVNAPSANDMLVFGTPFGLKNSGVATVGELIYTDKTISAPLLFRVSSAQVLYVTGGTGGGNSSQYFKTGYYSFCFFWFKA